MNYLTYCGLGDGMALEEYSIVMAAWGVYVVLLVVWIIISHEYPC